MKNLVAQVALKVVTLKVRTRLLDYHPSATLALSWKR